MILWYEYLSDITNTPLSLVPECDGFKTCNDRTYAVYNVEVEVD